MGAGVLLAALCAAPTSGATLEVLVDGGEAVVTLDGQLRGLAPRTETLPPGAHDVLVEAPGRGARRARVELGPGEVRRLRLSLPPPPSPRGPPVAGLVSAGVGVAALATGLLLRFPAEQAALEVSRLAALGGAWDERAAAVERAGLSCQAWSWLLTGAGALLVGAGALGAALHWHTPGPAIALAAHPGGWALALGGRW